jgi:hypothetical protein
MLSSISTKAFTVGQKVLLKKGLCAYPCIVKSLTEETAILAFAPNGNLTVDLENFNSWDFEEAPFAKIKLYEW